MFTGIITSMGTVADLDRSADGVRLSMEVDFDLSDVVIGASINHAGCCLTVVTIREGGYDLDVSNETLAVTNLGTWEIGTRVNLERALKIGDELGGHIVAGHADGVAILSMREDLTAMARLTWRPPAELARFIAPKGSVALDGVSLTVNEVDDETFSVLVIPHTLQVTTLGALAAGRAVNIEVDLMARYAARLIEKK